MIHHSIFKKIRTAFEKKKKSFNKISQQFFIEEIMNVVTHLPPIFLFSFFGGILISSTDYVVSNIVYILSLVNLYTFSVLYHAFQKQVYKKFLQLCDHVSIYLLIGGSYTPILAYMNDNYGLAYIWLLIGAGIIERIFFIHKLKNYSSLFLTKCILAGVYILSIKDFYSLPAFSFWMIVTSGFSYIAGSYFFVSSKKYSHNLWHLAVIAGSVCHFLAVYFLTK